MSSFRDKQIAYENRLEREYQQEMEAMKRKAEQFERICENLTDEVRKALSILAKRDDDKVKLLAFASMLEDIAFEASECAKGE